MASTSRKVESYRLPQPWPASVEALLAQAERERISFGADWYRHLAATSLGAADQAWLHVLFVDGQAVAALPVLVEAATPSTLSALSNFYTWLYAPIALAAAPADALVVLIKAAGQMFGKTGVWRFAPMDPASPSFHALADSLRSCGLRAFDYFCHGNWYLPIITDWPTYRAQRDGQLRTNLTRGEKRLANRQAVIEIISDSHGLEAGITAYQTVYAASWKKPEPHPEYMPGLIRLCAQRGWLRLGLVHVDEQPIAAQVWIVANGRADIYKLAYDENHKALGAGTVLSARMFEHAINVDRVTEIDYLIGDDPYKALWMNARRERRGLVAYNPRTAAGLWGWAREVAGRQWRATERRVKAWRNPAPA